MRVDLDKIEIKDPPIEELSKKRSCFFRSMVTGCGCFVFAFVISLLVLRFSVGPRTKEIKDMPQDIKETVTIYDIDGAEKIIHTPGKERGRLIEAAGYAPKLLIAPFVVYLDKQFAYIPIPEDQQDGATSFKKFTAFMGEPITDHRDMYTLEWKSLPATRDFIEEYYRKGLERQQYTITNETNNDRLVQFFFSKDSIEGTLRITGTATDRRTESVLLTITLPSP